MSARFVIAAFALLGVLSLPTSAFAQGIPATREQAAMNDRAIEAAAAGDLPGAIDLLEQLTSESDLNVYWLNLGRAYQRAGRCADAIDAFSRALTSRAIDDPPREKVRETATRYLNELVDQCPGEVTVICAPSDWSVTVRRTQDAAEPRQVACGETVQLVGGEWTFTGRRLEIETTQNVSVRASQATEVRFVIDPEALAAERDPSSGGVQTPAASSTVDATGDDVAPHPMVRINAERTERRAKRRRNGLLWLSAGSTIFVGGVVLDGVIPGFPKTARNHQLDALDFVPATLYLVALPMIIVGVMNLAGL